MVQLKYSESGIDEIVNIIHKNGGMDFHPLLESFVAIFIEAEVRHFISAAYYEHTGDRVNYHNGFRERKKGIKTGLGTIFPKIPKLRSGSFYPSILTHYSRIDKALMSILVESYINGVSTRKIERIFKDCNIQDIDKSLVSRCSADIEEKVEEWRNHPLEPNYAYIWIDAIYTKIRVEGLTRSNAVLIATGVRKDGYQEVLGFQLGNKESKDNWKEFFQSLKSRGLVGCELWISDDHDGIKQAMQECFPNQQRQRCIIHWMRNAIGKLSKSELPEYLPLLKNIINSRTKAAFNLEWDTLINKSEQNGKYKFVKWLEGSYEEIIIYLDFPPEHWAKIKSTNPIERLNKEIRRRERVVEIFPNEKSCIKLIGAQLQELSNSWLCGQKQASPQKLLVICVRSFINQGVTALFL